MTECVSVLLPRMTEQNTHFHTENLRGGGGPLESVRESFDEASR